MSPLEIEVLLGQIKCGQGDPLLVSDSDLVTEVKPQASSLAL